MQKHLYMMIFTLHQILSSIILTMLFEFQQQNIVIDGDAD